MKYGRRLSVSQIAAGRARISIPLSMKPDG